MLRKVKQNKTSTQNRKWTEDYFQCKYFLKSGFRDLGGFTFLRDGETQINRNRKSEKGQEKCIYAHGSFVKGI